MLQAQVDKFANDLEDLSKD